MLSVRLRLIGESGLPAPRQAPPISEHVEAAPQAGQVVRQLVVYTCIDHRGEYAGAPQWSGRHGILNAGLLGPLGVNGSLVFGAVGGLFGIVALSVGVRRGHGGCVPFGELGESDASFVLALGY